MTTEDQLKSILDLLKKQSDEFNEKLGLLNVALQEQSSQFDFLQVEMKNMRRQQEDLDLRFNHMQVAARSGLPDPLSRAGGGYGLIEPESRWRKERPFRR